MIALPKYLITVAGEIPLRSVRTRPRFYRALTENIEDAVERSGGKVLNSKIIDAKILLETNTEVEHAVARVFGVHKVGKILEYEFKDLKDLAWWVCEQSKNIVRGKTFAVRVKRSGQHSFTSIDIAREVGALLKPHSSGVNLENPDVTIELEVRESKAYLYLDSTRGPGGIPTGVEGSALVLFSGGYDSPVAAWLTAKRGVRVDFLHFLMGSAQSTYFAFNVAKLLAFNWLYGYRPRFILVDFRDVILEITRKIEWRLRQVVLRAMMYVVASKFADKMGYDAIITGESIGQASSQTLKNLLAIEKAVRSSKIILRPLLSFDKEEIISLSRQIGLYDLSSKVAEACAIAPTRVETAASVKEVEEELAKIDSTTIDKVVSTHKTFDLLKTTAEEAVFLDEIEIDFIPEDALVVDIRSEGERRVNTIPNAVSFDSIDVKKLPRDKVIVLICETGGKSYFLARILREEGFKAYSLRGGARSYYKIQ